MTVQSVSTLGGGTPAHDARSGGVISRFLGTVFFMVLLLVVVGGMTAFRYHLVATPKGTVILTKRYLTLQDCYVDVRDWSSTDYDDHPELKRAMEDQGYGEIIRDVKRRELHDTLFRWRNGADRAAEEGSRVLDEALEDIREIGEAFREKMEKWVPPPSEPERPEAPPPE